MKHEPANQNGVKR